MNFFDFTNAKVVIAGGGSGFGFEFAKAFVSAGAQVIIFSRRKEVIDGAVSALNKIKKNSTFGFSFDVLNEQHMNQLQKRIAENFSHLNIAINSAGMNIRNKIQDISLEEWHRVISVNLDGGFNFAKAMYPLFQKQSWSRFINLTSIFSKISFPERSSYAAAKGGLLQLSKTLALEWAKDGITVNTISPGPFLTDINKAVLDNPVNYQKFCDRIPLNRFGNPQEIVTACLFLASQYSTFVTGSDVIVDGGWTST